jgi:glutaryl-CoA dehydrogenase (non-decarboxylating)
MGSLGFFSCALPEELGGSGMGFMESVLMAGQLAMVSASRRLPFNMQHPGPALTVAKFGTPEQKKKYIGGWVAETQLGFLAMTESNTGSDVASMKTHAIDRGEHWEVHGSKRWISQAQGGDAGLRYAPTGEFVFEGMKVPKENVRGRPGDGFRICMWQLNQTGIDVGDIAERAELLGLGQSLNYSIQSTDVPMMLVVLRKGTAAAHYVMGGPTANRHNAFTPGPRSPRST